MERLCFTFEIEPGTGEEYDRMHREIWPELSAAILDAGYRNYSLFRHDTQIVCVCECHPDVATAAQRMAERHLELTVRWNHEMAAFIVRDEQGEDRRTIYELCWHLDEAEGA